MTTKVRVNLTNWSGELLDGGSKAIQIRDASGWTRSSISEPWRTGNQWRDKWPLLGIVAVPNFWPSTGYVETTLSGFTKDITCCTTEFAENQVPNISQSPYLAQHIGEIQLIVNGTVYTNWQDDDDESNMNLNTDGVDPVIANAWNKAQTATGDNFNRQSGDAGRGSAHVRQGSGSNLVAEIYVGYYYYPDAPTPPPAKTISVAPEKLPHVFTAEDTGSSTLQRKLNDNFESIERQLMALDPDNQGSKNPQR